MTAGRWVGGGGGVGAGLFLKGRKKGFVRNEPSRSIIGQWMAVGGGGRWAAVGGWRLVVLGGCPYGLS